ncbi:unnamed protein product, partial [Prunus brigantina]
MLPSFYGLPNEDPLTHIKDIFNAVSSFPLTGVTEDQLRMRVFPYTLKDKAKYWLNSLKPGSLTTWGAIQRKFLEKYFSTQKTDMLRDKILLFAQQDDESFCEAWERFNGLLNQCPHHGIPLKLQMRMFHKGLTPSSHNIVTNFAGGSYKTKTPEETYELFEAIAMETQHTDTRGKRIVGGSNDSSSVQISKLEQKLDALLALSSRNPSKEVCSICETHDHPTISCPLGAAYPEFVQEQAKLVNSYNRGPINDPYSQSYNPENEDEEETTAVEGERPKTSQSAPKAKSDSQEPNPFQLHKRDDKFIPAYGKFIKHLITHKLNFAPSEEVKLNKNVSAVLQRKLPPKLEDPGSFDIPINIGDKKAGRAMLDLGASINVMPYSVYRELGLEGMKKTSIRLELADHSIKYPKVMDMEDNPHEGRVDPILLGRPFMATANTIINVKDGTLSMTVLGETIAFKVFDAPKPNVVQECFQIEV